MWSFRKEVHKINNTVDKDILCGNDFSFSSATGKGRYFLDVNLGTDTGLVSMQCFPGNIPDRFQIFYDGAIVADSLLIGDYLTGNPPDASMLLWGVMGDFVGSEHSLVEDFNWDGVSFVGTGTFNNYTVQQTDVAPFGSTSSGQIISFTKNNPLVKTATIVVTSFPENTGWNLTISCPQNS